MSSPDLTARFVDAALLLRAERGQRDQRRRRAAASGAVAQLRPSPRVDASSGPSTPRGIPSLDALPAGEVDEQAAFNVLVYNVGMLPFGRVASELLRVDEICDVLLAASPRYDVICLQELFANKLRARFAQRLGADYHVVMRAGEDLTLNLNSGLFIASRFPLRATPLFEHFNQSTSWDSLADKGALTVLLEPPSGPPLVVCNTHLQSDYGRVGEYAEIRQDQLRQVKRVMAYATRLSAERTGADVAALLVGDFNVVAELGGAPTAEYRSVRHLLGEPLDLFRVVDDGAGYTWDPANNSEIPAGRDEPLKVAQRLDYAFSFGAMPSAVSLAPLSTEVLPLVGREGKNLSDHYGLSFRLAPLLR